MDFRACFPHPLYYPIQLIIYDPTTQGFQNPVLLHSPYFNFAPLTGPINPARIVDNVVPSQAYPLAGRTSIPAPSEALSPVLPPFRELPHSDYESDSEEANLFPGEKTLFSSLRSSLKEDITDHIVRQIAKYFAKTSIPRILPYKSVPDFITQGIEDILKYEPSVISSDCHKLAAHISPHLYSIIKPRLVWEKLFLSSYQG